jgi:hypothetical protein
LSPNEGEIIEVIYLDHKRDDSSLSEEKGDKDENEDD